MPKTPEYKDPERIKLINVLKDASKEKGSSIWKALAEELSRSRKNRRAVNISKLNTYTSKGDMVVVPGKILGDGIIDHEISIAAFDFSQAAKEKVKEAGGEVLTIPELMEKNPKGSNIKIIG